MANNIISTATQPTNVPVNSLTEYLPANYNIPSGWLPSFIKAIDANYAFLENFITDAQNQFYLATAEGQYFLNLINKLGFNIPEDAGLSLENVRQIAPLMVYDPKQITITLVKLMEMFYTSQEVRPTITSGQKDPYGLLDGDNLEVTTNIGTVNIEFNTALFNDPNNVTAIELAGYINSVQSQIFATVYTNVQTKENYLQLISDGYGLGATIGVTGGTAQNLFQFPTAIATTQTEGTTWNLSKVASYNDVLTFTWTEMDKILQFI